MSSEEQKPFLDSASEEDVILDDGSSRFARSGSSSKNRTRFLAVSLFANVILLLVCVLLSAALLSVSKSNTHGAAGRWQIPDPYSPANDIVEYEYRPILNDTRFVGHPGEEWDKAIHELMQGTLLRISDEELAQSGSDSIPLKGGGYAAGLGVAHSLHCVKKIKEFIYFDHFHPDVDKSGAEYDYLQSHADHCLDFMRQGAMCHIDYSLYTVFWGERRQDIPTHNVPEVQKCVSWDKLHKWMEGRAANTDMLVGP